jgi:hypothetical protein
VLVVVLVLENPYNIGEGLQYRRGTGQISEEARILATLLSFVLCSLLHAHEVPARQGCNIGEGQVKYRKKRVFYATLLSFVLYSLPHSHEVPARQG